MKTLVIAEKPDMGRNIASAIEPRAVNKRTHLVGQEYVITWAIGHLIGLAEPDLYDERYKRWNFQDLPIIPEQFRLLPNPRTKDQLRVIEALAADCGDIVNACDAGREGQLIFSYIQQHLRLQQPVRRLWISDLTPETIRQGFAGLKEAAAYENLTQAARARSEADWLVGMNGSRAFTTKHGELLSVGRVQTPVLALVYDRQKEIEAFDSQTYFEVEGQFEQGETAYRGLWQGERLRDKDKAAELAAKVTGQPGKIASYEVKETKEYPFKLYDLTLLQREANARHGFPAKKTLDLAQALYEKHKVISYPRTNSNYVNEMNIPEMYGALESLKGTPLYKDFAEGANKGLVHKNNKFVCNPAKVEDHHAILPTRKRASGLSPDEQKVYDLIVRRFLSQFYPPAEYKVHTVMTDVLSELFKTTVKQQLSPGWKVLLPAKKGTEGGGSLASEAEPEGGRKRRGKAAAKVDEGGKDGDDEAAEEETSAPFAIDPAAGVLCREAIVKEKATQPPKPFTEGTLLKAMETAGRSIEDDELRDAMKDCGLGTPATRAATIERLKHVGYIAMQGKRIAITAKGRVAIELIRGAGVTLLASPDMTGEWERRLSDIARGQASSSAFMESVKAFTTALVDKVRLQPRAARQAFAAAAAATAEAGGAKSPRTRRSGTAAGGGAGARGAASGGDAKGGAGVSGSAAGRSARSKSAANLPSASSAASEAASDTSGDRAISSRSAKEEATPSGIAMDSAAASGPSANRSASEGASVGNVGSGGAASNGDSASRSASGGAKKAQPVRQQAAFQDSAAATGAATPSAGRRYASAGDASTVPELSSAPIFSVPAIIGIADCPRNGCGGRIFMGRKGYGCSHYRNGCGFVIWKDSFGQTLSDTAIRNLIEQGRTDQLRFTDEQGHPFEARLVLKDRATGALAIEQ